MKSSDRIIHSTLQGSRVGRVAMAWLETLPGEISHFTTFRFPSILLKIIGIKRMGLNQIAQAPTIPTSKTSSFKTSSA